MDFLKCGTLNCRGIKNDLKQKQIATDMEEYGIDFFMYTGNSFERAGRNYVTIFRSSKK